MLVSNIQLGTMNYISKLLDLGYTGVSWLGCNCKNYHTRYNYTRVPLGGGSNTGMTRRHDPQLIVDVHMWKILACSVTTKLNLCFVSIEFLAPSSRRKHNLPVGVFCDCVLEEDARNFPEKQLTFALIEICLNTTNMFLYM